MTSISAGDLQKRIDSLMKGTARKDPTDVELAAMKFLNDRKHSNVVDLLVELNKQTGTRAYRPAV